MFNLNLLLILFIAFVDYLGIGLVYPIFAVMMFDGSDPLFAVEASASYRGAMLGILMGLTPLSAFLIAPFMGSVSDSYGRKNTLLFGMAAGTAGYALAVFAVIAHSLPLLFLFRILVGITEGSVGVAQAALADISTEENKARRFSLFSSSTGLGFTVGPFVGGILAEMGKGMGFGYSIPFLVAGSLCFVNLILIVARFPKGEAFKKGVSFQLGEHLLTIRKMFVWKHLRWFFASWFCLSFAWAFFNEFIPVLLQERFDFSLTKIGYYFAWGGVWYSISSGVLTAPLLARYPIDKLVMVAMGGSSVTLSLFSLMGHEQWVWITVPALMFFLAMAFPTFSSIVSNRASKETQGEVMGVYYSIQGFAMGLSPIFVGSIIGAYPSITGWGSALVMVLASLIFLIGRNERGETETVS